MAETARRIDRIDTAPRFTAADVARLNARFEGVGTEDVIRTVLAEKLLGEVAVVSSFGAESAVLLDLVARADPSTPVLFLETGKMFPETLGYRDLLAERLGLTDLRNITPDPAVIDAKDATGLRWSYDPDGCCEIRKVIPLAAAMKGFDASITGRKGFQASTRTGIPRFELDGDRIKFNPLADWTKADLDAWFESRDLPRHPLEAQGYLSIGCAPCTSVVKPGEDPRAGRWRGWDKVECGIHGEPIVRPGEEPVF
ncbi:phosphoadenosine phosphosulfate reductase [Sphingomonas sp. Root710]|uniref:phosphoadenylyl-sulfate reductase n=1 Tax=Sphingomonas sp. Root710 TaxID=1736594 RepID=UPI0006FDCBA1|nr:phosphoadenylyl-sulfate reductase [Sphingomonas sp. Root710]KRB81260.1 phosphoadenosine phosphosulfate reductase [Sphingomonas sp. Root710]